MSRQSPLLAAREFRKNYRNVAALDGVSFVMERGVAGLFAPNEARKSAAIKLFLGLILPAGGAALVMGRAPATIRLG